MSNRARPVYRFLVAAAALGVMACAASQEAEPPRAAASVAGQERDQGQGQGQGQLRRPGQATGPLATARGAAARMPLPAGAVLRTLEVGGLQRSFWTMRPASARTPAAVVFVLHGGASADGRVTFRYGLQDLGARDGVITVHPSGHLEGWNDGRTTPFMRARGGSVEADDVGFFRAMIDLLVAEGAADPQRIFVTGGSNGGMMSLRLACELSDRIAGAAAFIAWMPTQLAPNCQPARPIPILLMGGTRDRLMPFEGGRVAPILPDDRGTVLSAQETFAFWRQRNGCGPELRQEHLPDTDPVDGTRVFVTRAHGCKAPVALYVVEGGGHRLPGEGARVRANQAMGALSGTSSRDLDGARVIWDFLLAPSGVR